MTKPREILKMLQEQGWTFKEGANHTIAISPDGKQTIPIPRHQDKDVAKGTLHSILKAAGLK